ncbi:hypothetical protein B0T18DRAFT_435456 [Schizothecium vesticola]|uniref:Cyanamide hydratase n=1 Tax=Schizothecium vesticola TaxID=314040 RepID=A0AA40F451_9PEZI|nr:hypothetical protein B0T18DRAFT_435456 [Schizothecium vesticola]
MTTPHPDTVALHGWTAVPVDSDAILQGKPYLHKPTPLLAVDIPFPSSDPLVARVQAYAKSQLPRQTFNHSMRVFYWGPHPPPTIPLPPHSLLSPSTLALVSLLHDIGTAPAFLSTTQLSFEFAGALVARDLLLHPSPPVLETIIRHQDLGTRGTITFLGQLIQLATIYDNIGGHPELVHAETKVDVNRVFPRGGWSGCFAATVREEMRLKPWAHSTHLGEREFPEGVEGNELMGEFDGWE